MIVLTGASGKVGRKAAEILINSGEKLRLVARNVDSLKPLQDKGAELFPCDLSNKERLTEAFKGASVVFSIMPADFQTQDIGKHQDKEGINTIEALKANNIKKLVFLSSVGGHTEVNTGIVAGLARQEKRLNELTGIDICILRPSYFMENLYANVQLIKSSGINGSALLPDKKYPLIHTSDIAKVVAEKLKNPSFKGISVQALLGPKDYSMKEVTQALGNAIGIPDLQYVQFSYEDLKKALVQMGASQSIAEAYAGLSEGINRGVFNHEIRNAESTTETTIEKFAQEFAYAFKAAEFSNA